MTAFASPASFLVWEFQPADMLVVTSPLLGLVLAASFGAPQILPITSAPSSSMDATGPTSARPSVPNRIADTNGMLAALNAHRRSQGLVALRLDPDLCAIAYEHAADMLSRRYFDHDTPEGLSPFARMDRAHYTFQYAGENIALDTSAPAAEQALWHSSDHRKNILGAHYAKVGIAAVAGQDGEIVVEDFSD